MKSLLFCGLFPLFPSGDISISRIGNSKVFTISSECEEFKWYVQKKPKNADIPTNFNSQTKPTRLLIPS